MRLAVLLLLLAGLQAEAPRPSVLSRPISLSAAPEAFVQVNRALRAADPLRADFVEEKRIRVLKRPLISSGTLVFSARHGLYRAVAAPFAHELAVTSQGVSQRDAKGTIERFETQKHSVAASFVEAFLLVLSGDDAALARHFDLHFEGTFEAWSIGFVPRKTPLSKVIASIVIDGHGERIDQLSVVETSGDTTVTKWSNVTTRKALDEDEIKRLFGWSAR